MKRVILFSLGLIALSAVSGCATTPQQFNDTDVHFKIVSHQPMSSMSGTELYTIQVKSTSPLELTHLTMYLSYPIKTADGTQGNPFLLKGSTSEQVVNLQNGQSVKFSFVAPIGKVFGNSHLLDFKHPDIELDGFTKEGSKEIPFGMGGDLRIYLTQYK